MNTLIESMQQKLQDLTNRLDLLKHQFDTFTPTLGEDETLESLVASLQVDVGNMKTQVSNFQASINSLNNTCSSIVSDVENNTLSIQELQTVDNQTQQQLQTLTNND